MMKSPASATSMPPLIDQDSDSKKRQYYFDGEIRSLIVWVREGDYYVSSSPYEVLSTILGSCVAVCMRDPEIGVGGMNHFLLPEPITENEDLPSFGLRYGCYAIECLINALLSRGAQRERLEAKVFGGADSGATSERCGRRNVEFAKMYFREERIKLAASSVYGTKSRRLRYYPATGRAQVKTCSDIPLSALKQREKELAVAMQSLKGRSNVDLFNSR